MAVFKYAFNNVREHMAIASGRNLNISPKQCIEICNHIRGRKTAQAKMILEDAMALKRAIPFKRFTNGLGHKPGIASGRYAVNACTQILKIIKAAESNAKNKGLSGTHLTLIHAAAQRGPKQWHYGRQKRSEFKNCHVEIVVAEVKETPRTPKKKDETTEKKTVKKTNPKKTE